MYTACCPTRFVYKYCGIEDITQDILNDLYRLHFIPILAKALVFAFIPYGSYETDRELRGQFVTC